MKTAFIFLSVLILLYWVTAKIINSNSRTKLPNPLAAPIIAGVVIFSLMFITMVPAQTCGVVITPAGVMKKSYPTGWHIILPWFRIEKMDKTVQVYTCARVATEGQIGSAQTTTIWAPTVDGIKMGFDISASWSIDPEMAWWIYDNVSEQDGGNSGRFYWLEENVIKAKLKSALALTVSKYNPIEVYSNQRQNIQDEVFEKMKKDIAQYHLLLNQIDIREVYYNEAYENAINAKKLEEQRVLTLIEITKQKREQEIQAAIDKNIAIQQAEGEAEALRIKGQSVASNPKIVDLEWIAKWNGVLPTYMLGSNQGIMLGINK
ncbi:MAG: hypothetical protein LBD21_00205 [Tannerellaceae bacterium]|jgi:regulator of protease activity HflC (stomatin/prohibitin superfamily)|nr:hypothetical protein [Tannerellaceae bacterium]